MFNILSIIATFLSSRWGIFSAVLSALYVLYNNVLGVITAAHNLLDTFDGIVRPTLSGAGVSVDAMGLIDYVLPLSEAIAMFQLWIPFFLTCMGIRVIKSWIPTVA